MHAKIHGLYKAKYHNCSLSIKIMMWMWMCVRENAVYALHFQIGCFAIETSSGERFAQQAHTKKYRSNNTFIETEYENPPVSCFFTAQRCEKPPHIAMTKNACLSYSWHRFISSLCIYWASYCYVVSAQTSLHHNWLHRVWYCFPALPTFFFHVQVETC